MLLISRVVAGGSPLTETLTAIAEAATSVIVGASATSIVLATPGGGYRLGGSHGLSRAYLGAITADPSLLGDSATACAIARRRIVWISDVHTDDRMRRWQAIVETEGYRSLLAIPLDSGTEIVGTLCLYRSLPGSWNADEIDLLAFFAGHAATVVQTSRLLADQANQLAALRRLVGTLQRQTHEHANRLHALRGLLALGEVAEASRFLHELQNANTLFGDLVADCVAHPVVAGLLLAEGAMARQRGIHLEIDQESHLGRTGLPLTDSQLVTVVGNLLDNAFDAVTDLPPDLRSVNLYVDDRAGQLRLRVSDGGPGLRQPAAELCRLGASTKPGHYGAGLALVAEVLASAGGLLVAQTSRAGACIEAVVPVLADRWGAHHTDNRPVNEKLL
jgi:signal transduction histidine kinase